MWKNSPNPSKKSATIQSSRVEGKHQEERETVGWSSSLARESRRSTITNGEPLGFGPPFIGVGSSFWRTATVVESASRPRGVHRAASSASHPGERNSLNRTHTRVLSSCRRLVECAAVRQDNKPLVGARARAPTVDDLRLQRAKTKAAAAAATDRRAVCSVFALLSVPRARALVWLWGVSARRRRSAMSIKTARNPVDHRQCSTFVGSSNDCGKTTDLARFW